MVSALIVGVFAAPAVFDVTAFGASPDTRQDATDAVRRAILAASKSPGSTLRFPKGAYHFFAEHGQKLDLFLSNSDVVNPRRVSMLFEGLHGLKVEGSGARLVFHGRVIPIVVRRSDKVSFRGFEVDWERPLMSQAEVLDAGESGLTLGIDPKAYPYAVKNGKLIFQVEGEERQVWSWMEFDPKTRGVAYNTGDWGCIEGDWRNARATEVRQGVVRLAFTNKRRPKVGNVLVGRHGVRDHAGAFFEESKDIRLENMAFRHTSGLGVLAQRCENLTYRNVDVAPAPGSDRLFAGHDDGFHFSNCKGHIEVDHCRFDGLMDDPINIHGTSVRAIAAEGARTWRARFMHGQSIGFAFGNIGDEVSFIDHQTLLSRGTARIAKIDRLSNEEFRVAFDRDVPQGFVPGDALENLTWTPSATIRRCTFGPVRARGLLVTTPMKVVIEDNFFRSSGTAILIAGDANGWYESGAVKDVTIRRNVFENCLTSAYQFCEAVISVYPEIPASGAAPFHSGIRIEGNTFRTFDRPILWARSVDGLTFQNNRILRTHDFAPWHSNKAGLTFVDCRNVKVAKNALAPEFEGRSVSIERGEPKTISVLGWR